MGGAAGITMLSGMVRVKFAAMLIGIAGVGLNASFTAIQTLISTLAGLGLQSSAVRDLVAAVSKDDQQEIGRKVLTLRRICWLTGLIGMVTMMLLSPMISQITFGHQDYALDIAALGLTILFANLSGGQMALIQGMRRIGDIARVNVFSGILTTIVAIGFYATLGLRGIVPALVTASATQLVLSWYFARQVSVPQVQLGIKQTFSEANGMVLLGLVMMCSTLMVNAVTYLTVALITRQEGIVAVGLYSAAISLSGVFANFVLSAMAAEYYPRLTGVATDKSAMVRMVNEQTEIGLLLAVPGLLASMTLAPWIMQLFYSRDFLGAVELMQWFIVGCLGRVISWPLSYIMLAMGKARWYMLTETSFNLVHIALIYIGLKIYGISGVAIAFVLTYLCYIPIVYFVSSHLICFKWSSVSFRVSVVSIAFHIAILGGTYLLSSLNVTLLGLSLTLISCLFALGSMVDRFANDTLVPPTLAKIFRCISKLTLCYKIVNKFFSKG